MPNILLSVKRAQNVYQSAAENSPDECKMLDARTEVTSCFGNGFSLWTNCVSIQLSRCLFRTRLT